jgi:hypothetical protein
MSAFFFGGYRRQGQKKKASRQPERFLQQMPGIVI